MPEKEFRPDKEPKIEIPSDRELSDFFERYEKEIKKESGLSYRCRWDQETTSKEKRPASSVPDSVLFVNNIRDNPERALTGVGFLTSSDTALKGKDWPKTFVTANRFPEIADAFGYGKYGKGIIGKKILDIGSGESDFGEIANKLYGQAGTRVIEIDPVYSKKNEREGRPAVVGRDKYSLYFESRLRGKNTESAAGAGQKLPFKDKSFDEVVSNFGISLIPPSEIPGAIAEAVRVSKKRVAIGKAVVYHKIEKLGLPEGITLKQQNAIDKDLCLLEIEPEKISQEQARDYFEKLVRMEKPPFQFWADDELGKRRLGGYYYQEAKKEAEKFEKNG